MKKAPTSVWLAGVLPPSPRVAVVGARVCDAYGVRQARRLGGELASAGLCVVSGGAVGVDAAAHRGALGAGAATLAVLGTGIGIGYPQQNVTLFERMVREGGGLLSEHRPGVEPRTYHFPRRNELLAALCDAVIVVQARSRSGALVTARLARELGRAVLAVPGSAGASLSQGAHRLLREGATMCESAADVIPLLGEAAGGQEQAAQMTARKHAAMRVWRALGLIPLDEDVIAEASELRIEGVRGALQSLEAQGAVRFDLGAGYSRVPGRYPET